jgi:hypothetical protein
MVLALLLVILASVSITASTLYVAVNGTGMDVKCDKPFTMLHIYGFKNASENKECVILSHPTVRSST